MFQKGIRNIVHSSGARVLTLVAMAMFILCQSTYAQSFSMEQRLQNVPDSLLATSLDFGPDQRLYVTDVRGDIHILSIVRDTTNSPNIFHVVSTEVINSVRHIQNHNDDGALHDALKRQVTGILVVGTAVNPIIYVTSSDYRINSFCFSNSRRI